LKRQDAVRRVRALLRLADSTTFPAEAESAKEKAVLLMDEHGLDLPDLIERPRPAPSPAAPVTPYGVVYWNGARVTTTQGPHSIRFEINGMWVEVRFP